MTQLFVSARILDEEILKLTTGKLESKQCYSGGDINLRVRGPAVLDSQSTAGEILSSLRHDVVVHT
jgi:hypothetical protein